MMTVCRWYVGTAQSKARRLLVLYLFCAFFSVCRNCGLRSWMLSGCSNGVSNEGGAPLPSTADEDDGDKHSMLSREFNYEVPDDQFTPLIAAVETLNRVGGNVVTLQAGLDTIERIRSGMELKAAIADLRSALER